jgi:hypothetical protein
MTHEPIGPAEAAALLMAWLEQRGATFTLTAEGYVTCALDGADIRDYAEADRLATLVMVLRDEIRALLRAARTTH